MARKMLDSAPADGGGESGLIPVATLSRRDSAIAAVRRAIVSGALKPGEKLTESRLATSLNVSRPTMREAVAQLSLEGLLVQEPYRGLHVAEVEPETQLDVARTRMALDMLAAQEILADPSGGRLEMVEAVWAEYVRHPDDADPVEQHEAHVAFHRGLWEASENTLLVRLWPAMEAQITILLASDQATRSDPERARYVHGAIVEALRAGEMDGVRDALERHTLDSAVELVRLMDASESQGG